MSKRPEQECGQNGIVDVAVAMNCLPLFDRQRSSRKRQRHYTNMKIGLRMARARGKGSVDRVLTKVGKLAAKNGDWFRKLKDVRLTSISHE